MRGGCRVWQEIPGFWNHPKFWKFCFIHSQLARIVFVHQFNIFRCVFVIIIFAVSSGVIWWVTPTPQSFPPFQNCDLSRGPQIGHQIWARYGQYRWINTDIDHTSGSWSLCVILVGRTTTTVEVKTPVLVPLILRIHQRKFANSSWQGSEVRGIFRW